MWWPQVARRCFSDEADNIRRRLTIAGRMLTMMQLLVVLVMMMIVLFFMLMILAQTDIGAVCGSRDAAAPARCAIVALRGELV